MGSPCCGSHWRRAAFQLAAAEHPAGAERLAAAPSPGRLREPSPNPGPWAGWRMACGCWQASGQTERAARTGSRPVRSPTDLRVGQRAWPPAGQPTATVHVTRPTPRQGPLPPPSAQVPRQGLLAAVTWRDQRPGHASAAPAPVRRAPGPIPAWPDGGTRHDAGLGRDAVPPRQLRSPELRRWACRPLPVCLGASWPCPTSAPLTRCGWPHCSLART